MYQAVQTVKFIFAVYLVAVRGWILMLTVGGLSDIYGFQSIGFFVSAGIVWVVTSFASIVTNQDERDFKEMVTAALDNP